MCSINVTSVLPDCFNSKDVIRRWAYPVVPDNLRECYSYKRHNIYMAKDIILERYAFKISKDMISKYQQV